MERLLRLFHGFHVVFLEGYMADWVPAIEVYRKQLGEPLSPKTGNILAVCSEDLTALNAPHFPGNRLPDLAALIEARFFSLHRKRSNACA